MNAPNTEAGASRVSGNSNINDPSLSDILNALLSQKSVFFSVLLLGVVAALVTALLMPRYFVASTVVLPPQQQQSAIAGALAQLGSLAGIAGGAAGIKSPDEMYVAFFRTRRLQDKLIHKFDLIKRYEEADIDRARLALSNKVAISADKKTGLIFLEVQDNDANFAAELANAHVAEMRVMLSESAVSEAQQRRAFFEQQVAKAKEKLQGADAVFREEQVRSGFVISQALAETGIKESLQLRAAISAAEIQLSAIGRFATPNNVEFQRLTAQIVAMKTKLSRLETGDQSSAQSSTSSGRLAAQAYRELQTQEMILELLVKQFEMAKVEEAREGPLLQQIDPAVAPSYPTKPKRASIVILGAAISIIIAAGIAITRGMKNGDARRPATI